MIFNFSLIVFYLKLFVSVFYCFDHNKKRKMIEICHFYDGL